MMNTGKREPIMETTDSPMHFEIIIKDKKYNIQAPGREDADAWARKQMLQRDIPFSTKFDIRQLSDVELEDVDEEAVAPKVENPLASKAKRIAAKNSAKAVRKE